MVAAREEEMAVKQRKSNATVGLDVLSRGMPKLVRILGMNRERGESGRYRERGRESGREREGERARGRERVSER